MQETIYDVIIIGAGINGTGLARECAARGLKVFLSDKGDIASGTSSKSSKLIHGGLRYLETLQFKLVFESQQERARLLDLAPHLVRPLPFLIPFYKNRALQKNKTRIGLFLYDLLAKFKNTDNHRMLNVEETLEREPRLKHQDLLGGALYYDAQARDDARLCIDNWLSAKEKGAELLTHHRVAAVARRDNHFQVTLESMRGAPDKKDVKGRALVNAAGPWSDLVAKMISPETKSRLRLSKGVHIVLPRIAGTDALLLSAASDKRPFFVLPWFGNTMVGTTDTEFNGHPDQVSADPKDLDYLLQETLSLLSSVKIHRNDLIAATASLRPLLKSSGSVGKASREHTITQEPPGVFTIAGGKLTTYMLIARQTADKILAALKMPGKPSPESEPLARVRRQDWEKFAGEMTNRLEQAHGVSPKLSWTLVHRYGGRITDFIDLLKQDPRLAKPIDPQIGLLAGEIVYSFEKENARTMEDVLQRRTAFHYRFPLKFLDGAPFIEAFSQHRHLTPEAARAQWENLRKPV